MTPEHPDRLAEALRHLEQLPRASPPDALLSRIEAGLRDTPVIQLVDWRRIAAAAVLFLGLNASAVYYHLQQSSVADTELALITSYQLYEE
ncbi:hypothetical protein [Lewinella sp. JB7]|uniref:hypothetical protein n=1 Tax=Lewinella sp. JB7 TaxID=2962887 RepID=UPI0020C97427|nr:hypothetical protein [Lewinella sp. JB7]MCP9236281.1 hypothetical protein [Lewinella sp. JB7]